MTALAPYAPLAVVIATTLYVLADAAPRFFIAFRKYRHV